MDRISEDTYRSHTVHYRPDNQPYFVFNRWLAGFSPAELSPQARSDWQAALVDQSWQHLEPLEKTTRGEASEQSRRCLVTVAMSLPVDTWQVYAETARAHDHYREWQRWVGLYPLSAWFVERRIRAEQAEWRADYGGPFEGEALEYQPLDRTADTTGPEEHEAWLNTAYRDSPLGVPRLTQAQLDRLFVYHAPSIAVQQTSPADRLSGVSYNGESVEAAPEQPTLYTSTHYNRWRGRYLLQLSYTFWFPERPKDSALDLYGGRWNGLTWRVTLDESGQPLLYESLHNCGCYHQIWLPDHLTLDPGIEGEVPLVLPLDWHGRPRLTLVSGAHYIRNVDAVGSRPAITLSDQRTYQLAPYQILLALENGTGQGADYGRLFQPDGLVEGSARLERFVLWPFGIPSPGAMRQLGSHAIAFVGRRHFDQPDLLETLLVTSPAPDGLPEAEAHAEQH